MSRSFQEQAGEKLPTEDSGRRESVAVFSCDDMVKASWVLEMSIKNQDNSADLPSGQSDWGNSSLKTYSFHMVVST